VEKTNLWAWFSLITEFSVFENSVDDLNPDVVLWWNRFSSFGFDDEQVTINTWTSFVSL